LGRDAGAGADPQAREEHGPLPRQRPEQARPRLWAGRFRADLPGTEAERLQGLGVGGGGRLLARPGDDRARQPAAHEAVREGGGMTMKVREVIKRIEEDGWYQIRARGGHRQFKHPTKKGKVTVSGKPSDEVHPKTLNSILTQAGLKGD